MIPELIAVSDISEEDWERTPPSVKRLLESLEKRLTILEEENRYLHEQLGRNSSNSSQPPSSDGLAKKMEKPAKKSTKPRGGQKGHPGHHRELIPVEDCRSVTDYLPFACDHCGQKLHGEDPAPYRHQVIELPPIIPTVEEHRLHQLVCQQCGTLTRASLPDDVPVSGYGVRVVAITALLSGLYRLSERMVQTAFADIFGIRLALGTVNRLRQEASRALAETVEAACAYVQTQAVIHSDETGFRQGNADGHNPEQRKAWLWVAVTPFVTVFRVALSRSQAAAQALLGTPLTAWLITDRWTGYHWVPLKQRQLCWAHLKRDFTRIAEREGASGRIGNALLEQERLLFHEWHRVKAGTLLRSSFKTYAAAIRIKIRDLLEQGAAYQPTRKEKTALALTSRTCRELLKVETALWLFVRVEGIEPTNNTAERAIRPAVLWRKNSFGTQSAEGSVFVARLLTTVSTLRSQNRKLLEYLVQSCQALRDGKSAPSLLPETALA